MCGAVVPLCGGSDSCQCWFAAVSERACLVRGCQNEKSLAVDEIHSPFEPLEMMPSCVMNGFFSLKNEQMCSSKNQ